MVRGVAVLLLIVGLVAAAALAPRWLGHRSGAEPADRPEDVCRPLAEECRWQSQGGSAALAMARVEGNELLLELTLPGASGKPMAVLTGESMYMGEYPLALAATDDPGRYRVRFVPPFCTTGGDMTWRVHLRDGSRPLVLPFRILFRPPASG